MLTPNQLEKATPGYRSGYNDAIRDMPKKPDHDGKHTCSVWWRQDYEEGYAAGLNDLRR